MERHEIAVYSRVHVLKGGSVGKLPRTRSVTPLALLLFVSSAAGSPTTSLPDRTASLRQARPMHTFKLGIGRPSGLTYFPGAGIFLILKTPDADPEGVDADMVGMMTSLEESAGSFRLPVSIPDPMNVAFDGRFNRLLLLDASSRQLLEIPTGSSGVLDVSAARRYEVPQFAPLAARGMTVDPVSGSLFILDGRTQRVIRISPDSLQGDASAALRYGRVSDIPLPQLDRADLRGIAFNPGDGRLYLVSPSEHRLYQVTVTGRATGFYDLASLDLRDPRAIVFAPSRDRTDDPSTMDLYVADTGIDGLQTHGHVFELSLTQRPRTAALESLVSSSLVRLIDTSRFSPPSPDPSGLTYDSLANRLVISDGEVEEMSIWAGVNLFETTLSGSLLEGFSTRFFSDEPVGVAFHPLSHHLFFSDDDSRKVFDVDLGADGRFGTSDDRIRSFSTTPFGSGDPEGIAVDSIQNHLFIADGVNAEVYEILPGVNGVFDGVPPGGDDQVKHFDTSVLGIQDPETVEFNPDNGNLFIIGHGGDKVVEMTNAGALVREIDTSYLNLQHPAGLAYAPGSIDPSVKDLYIATRGVDNCSDPKENDGKVFEIAIGSAGGTTPDGIRVASSSDDAEEKTSGSMSLTSGDLELVYDGGIQKVGIRFNGVSVPQGATITSAYAQFKVDEVQSEATSLAIQGQAADNAPTFTSATGNVSSRARTASAVFWSPPPWTAVGQVGLDQRTPDLSAVIQEIVNRPGWASGNSLALIITGTGHRTAKSFDGDRAGAPLLHIELGAGTGNRAPFVDAGPDLTITLPASAVLEGTETDDGLPNPPGAVVTTWSVVSGPGAVSFTDGSAVDTAASFSTAGTYLLRLTVDDGALSASDTVTILVRDPGSSLALDTRVAAGSDDAEEKSSGSMYLTSSDLELVYDGGIQKVGIRFTGITIPPGATITSAHVQFKVDEVQSEVTSLTIQAQAADNAPTFTSATGNVSLRARTAAAVPWSPSAWTAVGQVGPDQRTPDLSAVIQEIVDRPGWASGNSLALIITGTGHRTAKAFEGDSTGAPLLHVEYR